MNSTHILLYILAKYDKDWRFLMFLKSGAIVFKM